MAPGYREIEIYFTKNPKQSFPVGTLAEKENSIYFEYHQGWLDSGLELSPFTLPCKPGLIKHSNHGFGPLFGLFDDSLPDGWGLLLMDRFFRNQGIDLVKVSVLDRLLYLGPKIFCRNLRKPVAVPGEPDLKFWLVTTALTM
ncbi:MAG: HipA N-terminal domain-containing protein [Deltaproteobacteria bacterium]|nr:HipA N-terminal domain-containing protein [Deltaproteobacteria bacterium]